ncbi:MAG: hypothetical protein ACI87E_002736 [Mariniblastus sp.]|jgi:hypothetical protein
MDDRRTDPNEHHNLAENPKSDSIKTNWAVKCQGATSDQRQSPKKIILANVRDSGVI